MGMTYTVEHAERFVRATADGPVTLEDIRAHIESERLAGALAYRELIDARGASPAFSSEDIRVVVAILRRLGGESLLGPTAVIVDSQVGFGILRIFEALLDDVCAVKPFYRMDSAEEWLSGFREGNDQTDGPSGSEPGT